MSRNDVRRLSEENAQFLRARSIVPSIHSAVEELVLNSIDAQCTTVEVCIDFNSHSIHVVDNGLGMNEDDIKQLGSWNHTSKSNRSAYGMKGEALAAICDQALEVEIMSREEGANKKMTKTIGYQGNTVAYKSVVDKHFQGTSIHVRELMYGQPVRRKATKESTEARLIEDFVRKMSVLHHSICWRVTDVTPDRIERVMCSYVPHDSIAEKFASIHGRAALQGMEEVSNSVGPFIVQGMLTPPKLYCCYTTRRGQYAYLNQRWLKCNCFVGSIVNELYDKFLTPGRDDSINKERQRYPNFVLQIRCPEEEYEILSEPDKTQAFFRNERQLIECVAGLVRKMFEKYLPQHLQQLNHFIEWNLRKSSVQTESWAVNGKSFAYLPNKDENSREEEDNVSYPGFNGMSHRYLSWMSQEKGLEHSLHRLEESPHSLMFTTAFGGSSSSDPLDSYVRVPRVPKRKYVDSGGSSSSDEELQAIFGVSVSRQPHHNIEAALADPQTYGRRRIEDDEVSFVDDDAFYCGVQKRQTRKTSHCIVSQSNTGHVSHSLHSSEKTGSAVHCPAQSTKIVKTSMGKHPSNPPSMTAEPVGFTLNKNELDNVRIVGQCDNKFVVAALDDAVGTGSSQLLVFDQHAVDERINFERLSKEFHHRVSELGGVPVKKRVNETLIVDDEELFILQKKETIFQKWGFEYTLGSDTAGTAMTTSSSCFTSESIDGGCVVYLHKVPEVLGETLSGHSLKEFIHYVDGNMNLPDSLLKPPAVQRILASKACHSSVRFGDSLTHEGMQDMLTKLSHTDTPFHCAHGRPSVVPLATLVAKKIDKSW